MNRKIENRTTPWQLIFLPREHLRENVQPHIVKGSKQQKKKTNVQIILKKKHCLPFQKKAEMVPFANIIVLSPDST
jgi:hypothetical protein